MSILRDLYNNLAIERGISPVVVSDDTAFVSQVIDMQNCSAVLFVIATGTLADAGATFTTLLEESDASNMANSNAVADTDMLGTEAGASFDQSNDNQVFKLGYVGTKRYIRLTITPAGNSASAPVSAVVIKVPHIRGTVN